MDHARLAGSVILTNDLDFGAILAATNGNAPSVLQIRSTDLSTESIGSQIIKALNQTMGALTDGTLVTGDARRFRLTLLPMDREKT